MGKTVRITLDVELRPLTVDELEDSGADQLPDDCQPAGDDSDLDEVEPHELADAICFAVENDEELWSGTNQYAAVANCSVVEARDV